MFNSRLLHLAILTLILALPETGLCDGKKFKIGVNAPLTGESAEFGIAAKNGIELARSLHSDKFQELKFVYEDNKYDAKTSITAFNKLKDLDKVNLTFVWGDTPSLAVAQVAERSKSPVVAVLTDHKSVKDFNYTVRFLNSYDQYADALVTYLRKQGFSKAAIVVADQPYYTNYYEGIQTALNKNEQLTLIDNYQSGATDFKTSILKIRSGDYDYLGLFLLPGQISTMSRQMKGLGVSLPTFGADDFESNTEVKDSEGGLEGGLYALNKVSPEFRKLYVDNYERDTLVGYAANAYEFALLCAKIFSRSDTALDGESIIAKISAAPPKNGVTGHYAFKSTSKHGKYFHFPVVVKKIVGLQREIVFEQ